MVRVQVEMSEEDRERFSEQAKREGKTLDAWLVSVGRQSVDEPAPVDRESQLEPTNGETKVGVGQSILDIFDELHGSMPEGALDGLPADGSRNYKHYLYGFPKVEDER